jgi:hypothetical protein
MSRYPFIAAWLVLCLTTTARAQTQAITDAVESGDPLILSIDLLVGSREPAQVFLQKGQVYRVELNREDVSLEFRTPNQSIQPPFFSLLEGASRASRSTAFEVYPRADAMYEVRIVGGLLGESTTLKFYRDVSGSEARSKLIASPSWEVGMEVAFGGHSAYPIRTSTFAAPAQVGDGGADVDFCFAIRSPQTSAKAFGGCAFGVGFQSRPQTESNVVWVFTEPRFRIAGGRPDRTGFEGGILVRMGIGIVNAVNVNPVAAAPGVYLSRHVRSSDGSGGWSLTASYAHAWISGTDGAHSDRFALGVGWYR